MFNEYPNASAPHGYTHFFPFFLKHSSDTYRQTGKEFPEKIPHEERTQDIFSENSETFLD